MSEPEAAFGDRGRLRAGAVRAASLLDPRAGALARWRLGLLVVLAGLVAWLVGPFTPWQLPGPQQLPPPKGQKLAYTVSAGLTVAALVNAALCLLLLASSGRWAGDLRETGREAVRPPRLGRGLALLVLAAAALAGALRWPLAQQSLWWDEAWSVRKVIVGEWRPASSEGDPARFDRASWLETLWYYRTPTNHVLYSAAARASLGAWRAATGAPREAFDEFALRLPAWLAAIASVIAIALLVRDLGFPRAAPVAAFLLAVHPWHVRYGADGRGYAFVVLATIVGAWFLLRALRSGRWRDALGFAASQLAVVWTFPAAVYVPVALGAGAGFACVLGGGLRDARSVRLAVAALLAGMAFLQVMTPNVAQFMLRTDLAVDPAGVPSGWVRHLWVYLAVGLQARAPQLPDVEFPTLVMLSRARPWLPFVVYGVIPALAMLGLARAWLRGGAAERGALAGVVLAVPLLLLHRELDGFALMHRWAVFGLPACVLALAIGLDGALGAAFRGSTTRHAALPIALAVAVSGFAAMTAPQLRILLTRPVEPTREVLAALDRADADAPVSAIRAGVGLGGDVARVYDPSLAEIRTVEQLAATIREAREAGRPLLVFYGYGPLNRRQSPELFAVLDDPRTFAPIARLDGIESQTVFRVLRYTGK